MNEPQGPLPPEVYWRRRLVAGAGAVVVIVAVIILIVALSGRSNDDSNSKNAAATSSASSSSAPAAPPSTSAAPPPSSEAPSGGGNHGAGGDPSETAKPSESAPAPGPAPAGGPAACSDQSLSVVLYTDKPTYTVGDHPVFTIVTTNGGLTECSRDVGKAAQNVIVRTLDGSRTLWAAQDCAPDPTVNVQTLQPGQQVNDTLTWSGTTSSPQCKKKRVQIVPGGYQAIAKVGERESAPITFNVVAPAQPGGQ